MLVFVKSDWQALSTMPVKKKAQSDSEEFVKECLSFGVEDSAKWVGMFDTKVSLYSFGLSPKLSCYLFSIIAGPYDTIESDDPLV